MSNSPTRRQRRGLGMTCVAVILIALGLAGCGDGGSDPVSTGEGDALSGPTSPGDIADRLLGEGYDEFQNWSTGVPLGVEFGGLEDGLGSFEIYEPTVDKLEMGVIGVAEFEPYCILVFSTVGADIGTGQLSAVVLSRYNGLLQVYAPSMTLGDVAAGLEPYRPFCSGERPLADIGQLGVVIVPEVPTPV